MFSRMKVKPLIHGLNDAYRISAREFREEYLLTKKQIAQRSERLARGLGRNELGGRLQEHILDHFEKLRRNT